MLLKHCPGLINETLCLSRNLDRNTNYKKCYSQKFSNKGLRKNELNDNSFKEKSGKETKAIQF